MDASFIPVAHVLLSLRVGGLERVVVDLVNAREARFEPLIVCLETSGPMQSELRDASIPVVELKRRPGFRPWLALPLARLLRRHRVRIVHTHNTAAGFYGGLAAILAGVPVVHTKHGQNLDGAGSVVRRIAGRLADRTVAVSEPARALALSGGARADRLSIIDNGVDLTRFSDPTGALRREARTLAGAADADVVVGTVGRAVAVKNQRLLLESAIDVAGKGGAQVVLVIVGDGPARESLADLARTPPRGLRVVLPGAQRAEAWLPAFDVFALSSDSEGLPIALLEAMACGIPPVVTRVGAMPAVVEGGCGLTVAPGDRTALADAIGRLVNDASLREAIGAAARSRVRERHSAERMARAYEALYRDVLGVRPPAAASQA